MPWSRNSELPQSVLTALPTEAQTVFRRVVNDGLEQGMSESRAIRRAWGAVKRTWKKPKDGDKWVKKAEEQTLYVSRPLENADEFIAWAKSQGFKTTLTPDDLHVTVAYSKEAVAWPIADDTLVKVENQKRTVQKLGDATVLTFESDVLKERWSELVDNGASWDWDDYIPHVTISWDADGVDLSKVEPYEGPLVFGPEILDEIDESFRGNITEKVFKAEVAGVSDSLGLVFGWAVVCKVNGEDYFDFQDDHIPEEAMLDAATDFMLNSRIAGEMHQYQVNSDEKDLDPVVKGTVVFAWPMTGEIAKAMDIGTKNTGLMIAMKPSNPEILDKFKSGEYKGFSIGGSRIEDEEVMDA